MCRLIVYVIPDEHPEQSIHRLLNAYKQLKANNIPAEEITIKYEPTKDNQSIYYDTFIGRRKIKSVIKQYSTQVSFPIISKWFEKEYPSKRYDCIPLVSFMKDMTSQKSQQHTLDNMLKK